MVNPDSHRVSRVPWYSGTCSQLLSISLTGVSPSLLQLPICVQLSTPVHFIHALQPLTSIHARKDEHECSSIRRSLRQERRRTARFHTHHRPPSRFRAPAGFLALLSCGHQCSSSLDSSLFARTTGGISIDFSSCGY